MLPYNTSRLCREAVPRVSRSMFATDFISLRLALQAAIDEIPVEVAAALSRRSHGVVLFPKDIEMVIEAALGPGKKRALRQHSTALVQELRSR